MEATELVDLARNYCGEYLGGVWQEFNKNIAIERIKIGMGNRTLRCSLKCNDNELNVIVKIYGNGAPTQQLKFHCEAVEAVVFNRLESQRLSPKLLGVFSGGRIEEYIYGRNITLDDLNDISMYKAVARKLAHFHVQQMPISRKPLFIPFLQTFINTCENTKDFSHLNDSQRNLIKKLDEFPLESELNWTLEAAKKINSKVVFSHNDLVLINIMLKNEGKSLFERLVFIDYELCDYSYRGIDMAGFLYGNEFDMIAGGTELDFKYVGNTATDGLKRTFAEEYLNELREINELGDECQDSVEHLVMEIDVFGVLWYLISLMYVRHAVYYSNFNFGSLSYINDFIEMHNTVKRTVAAKYSL